MENRNMALTKKDIELIAEILNRTTLTNEEIVLKQIDTISQSVEVNTNILNQMKVISENSVRTLKNSELLLLKVTNGMSTKIDKLVKSADNADLDSAKLDNIFADVCSKDGYLPKISAKLSYLWVPLILTFLAMVGNIIW